MALHDAKGQGDFLLASNRLGARDMAELDEQERRIAAVRAAAIQSDGAFGSFDMPHLWCRSRRASGLRSPHIAAMKGQ